MTNGAEPMSVAGSDLGDTVIDIMRTHPIAVVGGILRRNPIHVPPEQFVLELRERRARHGVRRATTG